MRSFLVQSVGSLQRRCNGMQPPGNINYHFSDSDLEAKGGKLFKAKAWPLKGEKNCSQMRRLNCKRVARAEQNPEVIRKRSHSYNCYN